MMRALIAVSLAGALALTAGCAHVGPDYDRTTATAVANQPERWQAPLPHGGSRAALADWWRQFDDPVLVMLVQAAQAESATVAQAGARIAQARATVIGADAALAPSLDVAAASTRGPIVMGGPPLLRSQNQAQLQTAWEVDLFGGGLRYREAALARLAGREAEWHDARVAIAAEIAHLYTTYRSCELLVAQAAADAASRAETARLTDELARAGFQSPGNAALARASAADAAARLIAQRAECELVVKGMVALSGLGEEGLRARLAAGRGKLPVPAALTVAQVPAEVLAQRPDIAAAEREVAAAIADIGVSEAQRYPRLALAGAIGPLSFESNRFTVNTTSWSIGPSLSIPLYDGGRRKANVESARVVYEAAAATYRERARRAVREVEEALVRLNAAAAREADARGAAAHYRTALDATERRWRAGLGSLIELEEIRRLAVAADIALIALERERVAAWISLYRAVGGGWVPPEQRAVAGVQGKP